MWKRLFDLGVYAALRALFGLLGVLPYPVARAFCRFVASLIYTLDKKHRRIGMTNLSFAFPDRSNDWRRGILRESFCQLGDLAVEVSRLHRLSKQDVGNRIRYEAGSGLENYLFAREEAPAVIFATAHISVWEILPSCHALAGYPLSFVVRPLDNPWLERWVSSLRCRFGNQVLPKAVALRQAMRLLKKGRDVGFLIDQNVLEKDGIFVPLFGRPASTTSAVARLAIKTGLPVVAGFIYPASVAGHYRIRFYPRLRARVDEDPEQEAFRLTALLNEYIEEVIREFPYCWLWGHRRFSVQPDGRNPYNG